MIFGLLLSAAVAAGDATDSWQPPRALSLEEPSGIEVRVSARAWLAMSTGWLQITQGSRPGSGTPMHVGSDVDLDPKVVPLLEATAALGESHGFDFSYTRISASGTRTADNSFVFHGSTFDAGRRVRADVDFTLIELNYHYTFNPAGPVRVTGRVGADYWGFAGQVKTEDSLPPLDTHRAFDSGFWMAGVDLSWRVLPDLELRALGAGGFERAHQNFFKAEADGLYRVVDHVAITAGYRVHALRFRQSTNLSNIKFHGPTIGVEISF